MKIRKETENCPTDEMLSAYYDQEQVLSAEQREHVAHCTACRERLQEYEKESGELRNAVQAAYDDGLSQRILNRVHTRLELSAQEVRTENPAGIRGRILWYGRVAALLVIGSLIGYLLYQDRHPAVEQAEPDGVMVTANVPHWTDSELHAAGTARMNPVFGAIDLRNITAANASFGGDSGYEFRTDWQEPGLSQRPVRPATIRDRVEQVWTVPGKSMPEAERNLNELLRKAGVRTAAVKPQNATVLELHAQLTKEEAVKLVRECHGAGMKLLSSEQPQPEQTVYYGNRADVIRYDANYVLNKTAEK